MPSQAAQNALARAQAQSPECNAFRVRLYDGFDNEWMDVPYGSGPMSAEEAMGEWDIRTKEGTEKTSYSDIDYYAIYPANTTMVYSETGKKEIFGES